MSNNLWDTVNRMATDDDVEQIAELEALSYEDCLTCNTIRHVMDSQTLGSQTLVVNVLDGDVLGYVSYARFRDDNDEMTMTIHRIAVHPSSRRRGIGWRLMSFCVDVARVLDCELQFITIPERNQLSAGCFLDAMHFRELRSAGCITLYHYTGDSDE